MYAGTESGRISAHSKTRRPGNSHVTTSHAVATPITSVSTPTPRTSSAEFRRYSGRTVEARCDHVSPAGANVPTATTSAGIERIAAISVATTVHGLHARGSTRRGTRTRTAREGRRTE